MRGHWKMCQKHKASKQIAEAQKFPGRKHMQKRYINIISHIDIMANKLSVSQQLGPTTG